MCPSALNQTHPKFRSSEPAKRISIAKETRQTWAMEPNVVAIFFLPGEVKQAQTKNPNAPEAITCQIRVFRTGFPSRIRHCLSRY
jgi:hypothetical protein